MKGNIATACIDFGLSKFMFLVNPSEHRANSPLVVVCLAVLFMQKRDERKARASESDAVSEDLVDDVDSKGKLSVDQASLR